MSFFLGLFFAAVIAREIFNGVVLVKIKEAKHLDYYLQSYVSQEYRTSAVLFSYFASFGFVSGAVSLLYGVLYDGLFLLPFMGLVGGYFAGVMGRTKQAERIISRLPFPFPLGDVLTVMFEIGSPESLFVFLCNATSGLSLVLFFFNSLSPLLGF